MQTLGYYLERLISKYNSKITSIQYSTGNHNPSENLPNKCNFDRITNIITPLHELIRGIRIGQNTTQNLKQIIKLLLRRIWKLNAANKIPFPDTIIQWTCIINFNLSFCKFSNKTGKTTLWESVSIQLYLQKSIVVPLPTFPIMHFPN